MLVAIMVTRFVCAVGPTPVEMDDARQWGAAKFGGVVQQSEKGVGIEVVANNGPLQANRRGGKPMHLGTQTFTRGLYAHAPSRLAVRLAQPGQRFDALVGVDTNDQTSGGRGSVVFEVHIGGKAVWTSDVRREGMPGDTVAQLNTDVFVRQAHEAAGKEGVEVGEAQHGRTLGRVGGVQKV